MDNENATPTPAEPNDVLFGGPRPQRGSGAAGQYAESTDATDEGSSTLDQVDAMRETMKARREAENLRMEANHLRREAATEGERMLTEAQQMAERLMSEARQRSSSLLNSAEARAGSIVSAAQAEAEELRARIDELVAEQVRDYEAKAAVRHANQEAELNRFRADTEQVRAQAQALLSEAASTVRGLRVSTQRMLDTTNEVHESLTRFETQLEKSAVKAEAEAASLSTGWSLPTFPSVPTQGKGAASETFTASAAASSTDAPAPAMATLAPATLTVTATATQAPVQLVEPLEAEASTPVEAAPQAETAADEEKPAKLRSTPDQPAPRPLGRLFGAPPAR